MRKIQILIISIAALFTLMSAGCVNIDSRQSDQAYQAIEPGMDKGKVLQILGSPKDRTFSNDEEKWYYTQFNWLDDNKYKIVVFKNGLVTGLENNMDAKNKDHELAVAKASATKIDVTQQVDTDTALEVDLDDFGF